MKIAFHENQLCFRGTSNAMFDYALYNQKLLGNESIIIYQKNNPNNFQPAINRFKEHFKIFAYENVHEIQEILNREQAEVLYVINSGARDEVVHKNGKTLIHAVFKNFEPYGEVYAYVSEWLTEVMTEGKFPYVPHIVHLPDVKGDYREKLGIPKDAIVFGRYGGAETFDIDFVKKTVQKVAKNFPNTYFLFMGTDDFVKKGLFRRKYKNIIFLPASVEVEDKVKFINTCDAHLHARRQGESFGIAVGEFSVKNKPTFTWELSEEKSHLQILGDKAIRYRNEDDLYAKLTQFKPQPQQNWDCYSEEFSPENVMKKFDQVFLQNKN